jgi:osmotically-inducible protein OsmY
VLANPPLQEAVIAALERDQRIPDPLTIAVSAQGNVVTLRGVVETFRQRHAAIDDVRQIEGVSGIDDQLVVKLGPMDRREDDEIRAAALQALIRDSEVPSESIDVSVRHGWVTLTGYVEYEPQRIAAYDHVATLDGVMGISNEIEPLGY